MIIIFNIEIFYLKDVFNLMLTVNYLFLDINLFIEDVSYQILNFKFIFYIYSDYLLKQILIDILFFVNVSLQVFSVVMPGLYWYFIIQLTFLLN